jgi:hypothetical protein
LQDRVSRTALSASIQQVSEAAIAGGETFLQAFVADNSISRNDGLQRTVDFAFENSKVIECSSDLPRPYDLTRIRKTTTERVAKSIDCIDATRCDDIDSLEAIFDGAEQSELPCQTCHSRANAESLNVADKPNALNDS